MAHEPYKNVGGDMSTDRELLEAMKRAKDSLVAFKFVPGDANRWEESDEENLAAVNSAVARAESAPKEPIAEPVNARLLEALKLAECVYRKNVVNEGEPSSVLEAMQVAIACAEATLHEEKRNEQD